MDRLCRNCGYAESRHRDGNCGFNSPMVFEPVTDAHPATNVEASGATSNAEGLSVDGGRATGTRPSYDCTCGMGSECHCRATDAHLQDVRILPEGPDAMGVTQPYAAFVPKQATSTRAVRPHRFTIHFVAGTSHAEDLYDWAVRQLESLSGVFVQNGSMEPMADADVVDDSPLDRFLEGRE